MERKHPRSPDLTDTGPKRAQTIKCTSAMPTYKIPLGVGQQQSLITDPQAYIKGASEEKPPPDPTGRGREQVYIELAQDPDDEQAATQLLLTGMDVDEVGSPEVAEDVVLRLLGNLISENEPISGPEQPRHDVGTHAANPAETAHNGQTSWTITLNGDLTTRKSSVALEGVPTETIPAVLRLVEALSTLLASSSTIPVSIPVAPCGPAPTLESPDLSSIRDNTNKATPIIGARHNQVIPTASVDAPFTDADVRTEINRVCAEAGEGIPNRARKEEIKKQYLEGKMKLFAMVAQLKKRAQPCIVCARDGWECLVLDEERERVLKAVRCVRCIAGKRKCEDA